VTTATTTTSAPPSAGAILWLPLADVHPGLNARGELGDVDGLAMSIQAVGQIQPVLVEEDPAGGYLLYDGHRRYAALMKLRAPRIKAVVQAPLKGTDRTIRQVAMHALGEHFDPIAECEAIYALYWERNLALEQIARMVGHSPAWVRDRLSLRNLTPGEQQRVRAGRMSMHEALAVVRQRRLDRDGKTSRWAAPTTTRAGGKDHLVQQHPQARAAGKLCRPQHHPGVIGKVACGACWEAAIRTDERSIVGGQ